MNQESKKQAGRMKRVSISLFDVTGPVMIGPSSSHTAGAARLGRMAMLLAGGGFNKVTFGLHGSFARTYAGHGTDRALAAGVLGMAEYDERLPRSFELARERGVELEFCLTELPDAHENSVQITFSYPNGASAQVEGCSLGGGRVCIRRLDGFELEMTCERPAVLVLHGDIPGMLGKITNAAAEYGLNIAVLRSTRRKRGDVACCLLETDEPVPAELKTALLRLPGVLRAEIVDPEVKEEGL